MIKTLKSLLVPIHPSGWRYIAAFAIGGLLVGWLISDLIGLILLLGAAFLAFFFRDPPRVSPQRDGLVLAPADGVIVEPKYDDTTPCIAIDVSPLDVQIVRSPVMGSIIKVLTDPDTQHTEVAVKTSTDDEITVHFNLCSNVGAFTPTVFEGDGVKAGQKLGVARALVSTHVHHNSKSTAFSLVGQKVCAGETVLLDAKSHEPLRESVTS